MSVPPRGAPGPQALPGALLPKPRRRKSGRPSPALRSGGTEGSPGCCDAEPSASWPAAAPERPRRQPRGKSAPGERAEGEILKPEWIPGKERRGGGECMVASPRAQGNWAKPKGAFTLAGRSLSPSFPTCGQKFPKFPRPLSSSPVRRKAAVLGARLKRGFNLDGLLCVCVGGVC